MNKQLIISVGLIQRGSEFLITRRICPTNPQWHLRWEFPGGKIKPGETPEEALHREIFEETALTVDISKLLGVHTHHWKVLAGTQQTFILLYHCFAKEGIVHLKPEENDAYSWETMESLLQRNDFLDGNIKMLHDLYNTAVLNAK